MLLIEWILEAVLLLAACTCALGAAYFFSQED